MEECIFPVEILENIAACDVFVAYTLRATCQALRTLRTQPPPKQVTSIYRDFKHKQFTRIVYEQADGWAVDYFNFGDWHVHNYYDCTRQEYQTIVAYNHRLQVYDVKHVWKKRLEYRTLRDDKLVLDSGDKPIDGTLFLDKLVLKMEPKLLPKYGFDYIYYIDGFNGIKYRIKLIVRPDESCVMWTYH